jgi:hypothetical protein
MTDDYFIRRSEVMRILTREVERAISDGRHGVRFAQAVEQIETLPVVTIK